MLFAAVFTPLLGGLTVTVPQWRALISRWLPLAVPLALALFGPVGITVGMPWIGKNTHLRFDAIAQIFMLFTSILWLAAGWYAQTYLAEDKSSARSYVFFLLAMAGHFKLIVAGDIPRFHTGFALMSVASTGRVGAPRR